MADLEKLALKRDRGYLVRLVLLLLLGMGIGLFIASYITGSNIGGCMADVFLGSEAKPSSR
ncbi:MAG: hypothetical protein JXA30_10845 [Deltaproteobacteria bacterium]|nr:hypothetical protein [Deltaproteobacteria bacterium]